ncbi:MAG TPA: DUF5700 domain-containing putative Zn-dependent protease [Thermoanaerobaculia bacterium]|nr:DUF5700 domain-containing putative Zn-dependent protease [Thermoanaerobaculia bacterium]
MIIAAAVLAATLQRVQVHFVPDEAEAVLAILDTRAAHHDVTETQWKRLFTSEGYVRLKKRESSMKRPFEDAEFRDFVLSDALLAKRDMLARTVRDWTAADLSHAAARALAYLPPNATIHAKVYPVIKPKSNSFVFEVSTDPAIFMNVDEKPREEFERTVAHEMHHIGFGTACATTETPVLNWIGAFGEGFAVLAAAGGPDAPPEWDPKLQKVWRDEMAKFDTNFAAVAVFLTDLADGRVSGDAARDRGMEFFAILGPWYTVGWKMGVVIEKTLGHEALINASCDPRQLLATYNRAAKLWQKKTGETLPLWPAHLVDTVR